MISRGELKRAVQQSLPSLRSAKDVQEAEVFASSNTQLLTRLNYTSHLPCNGVEEPKSVFAFGLASGRSSARARGTRSGSEASRVISPSRERGGLWRRLARRQSQTLNSCRSPNQRGRAEPSSATTTRPL